jgi:hypothetical protein
MAVGGDDVPRAGVAVPNHRLVAAEISKPHVLPHRVGRRRELARGGVQPSQQLADPACRLF